jgi:hypothetical protein
MTKEDKKIIEAIQWTRAAFQLRKGKLDETLRALDVLEQHMKKEIHDSIHKPLATRVA